ncbi:MAG: M1 family aminopeptidase [Minicystis sp.]
MKQTSLPPVQLRRASWVLFSSLALTLGVSTMTGCADDTALAESEDLTSAKPAENWDRDLLETSLAFDLAKHRGAATIKLAGGTRRGASFDVRGLKIDKVLGAKGPVPFSVTGDRLDLGISAHDAAELTIEYGFTERTKLQGALKTGTTFLWPYFCGNLFPCKPSPAEGQRFEIALTGVPAGQKAIFPAVIPGDAPSYMVAWAIGDYTQTKLGATSAGTKVSVFSLPGQKTEALKGAAHLKQAFDWFEKTYGKYLFGNDVGSVSANWGPGAFGGMEHHPYWHVSQDAIADEETHVHEAAHGWFGDGVRIRCWEDLALSEGTTSYVTARAIEAVAGKKAGDAVWVNYQSRLEDVVKTEDRLAWPDSCGEIEVLHDLWNDVPYMKGAFFYRAVEQAVGRKALDRALRRFYQERKGQAASWTDMLETIHDETGFDPADLAEGWLRSLGTPQ